MALALEQRKQKEKERPDAVDQCIPIRPRESDGNSRKHNGGEQHAVLVGPMSFVLVCFGLFCFRREQNQKRNQYRIESNRIESNCIRSNQIKLNRIRSMRFRTEPNQNDMYDIWLTYKQIKLLSLASQEEVVASGVASGVASSSVWFWSFSMVVLLPAVCVVLCCVVLCMLVVVRVIVLSRSKLHSLLFCPSCFKPRASYVTTLVLLFERNNNEK